jgi:hypothetical protein
MCSWFLWVGMLISVGNPILGGFKYKKRKSTYKRSFFINVEKIIYSLKWSI